MKYLLLSLMIFSEVFACEVQLPEQMIILNTQKIEVSSLTAKACTDKTLEEVISTLNGLEGNVANFQLKEMLASRGQTVTFSPSRIQVKQLKNIIQDQLNLPSSLQVKSIKKLNSENFLNLAAGERIEISCSLCPAVSTEQHQYNMNIHLRDGTIKSHVILADFQKRVMAYRLTAPVSSFSEIKDLSVLENVYTEEIPHTELISDLSLLKHLKTNKVLRKGDFLKRSDLIAVDLVKAGFRTEVILENSTLRIKTHGISSRNGGIGSWVEVYNPQKNKKYLGKVVDLNKVLVEL